MSSWWLKVAMERDLKQASKQVVAARPMQARNSDNTTSLSQNCSGSAKDQVGIQKLDS